MTPSPALNEAFARQGILPAPAKGPIRPFHVIQCPLGVELPAKRCAYLRAQRYPSGRRKGRPVQLACKGCPVGADVGRRLEGYKPPSYFPTPAEVLDPKSRAARLRWLRVTPHVGGAGDVFENEPVHVAHGLSPDEALSTASASA